MMVYDFGKVLIIGYYILPVVIATNFVDEKNCIVHCQDAGCTSMMIIDSDIACQVTYTAPHMIAASEVKIPEEEHTTRWALTNRSKTITSATKKIQCGKVTKAFRGSKNQEGQCSRKSCEDNDITTPGDVQSRCILFRQANITIPEMRKMLHLPLPLKQGMRLSVDGCYKKGLSYSQLSVPMDPKHTGNFYTWLHIVPRWTSKTIKFTEGFKFSDYEGDFPISDPCHFNLALELTPSATKIYADKVLLKTVKHLKGIKELDVHRFSKVHLLMVRKTGQGCGEVDSG